MTDLTLVWPVSRERLANGTEYVVAGGLIAAPQADADELLRRGYIRHPYAAALGGSAAAATTRSLTLNSALLPDETGLSDSDEYELGMKFTVNVAGHITAIRFYKDAADATPTHTGRIWNRDTSAQIASVVFTGETASGWQQQTLASPLAVVPGVSYAVSVNIANGTGSGGAWVRTPTGFPTTIGLFTATQGVLPTTERQANYFRDVVFEVDASSGPVPVDVSNFRLPNIVYANNSGRTIHATYSARLACVAAGNAIVRSKVDSSDTPSAIVGAFGLFPGLADETNAGQIVAHIPAGQRHIAAVETSGGGALQELAHFWETVL
jgi:hypothetical protein